MNLSGHQSPVMGTDEWLTPQWILRPLGKFDLDPCSPSKRPWNTAEWHYSLPADGLSNEWFGRVWCNPPFGKEAARWLARMSAHGNGIALIPARTETRMFFDCVWESPTAKAVCFIRSRPHFCFVDGTPAPFNSGAPICLVAYGEANAECLMASGLGKTILL